jgi:hypothetical protein
VGIRTWDSQRGLSQGSENYLLTYWYLDPERRALAVWWSLGRVAGVLAHFTEPIVRTTAAQVGDQVRRHGRSCGRQCPILPLDAVGLSTTVDMVEVAEGVSGGGGVRMWKQRTANCISCGWHKYSRGSQDLLSDLPEHRLIFRMAERAAALICPPRPIFRRFEALFLVTRRVFKISNKK